jgi:cytochrome d ubiquinol oxidase subunit I
VGDIFGAPLAAEGIFAFFLESSFLAIMLYGEKRVSRKMYLFSSTMVALGSTMSAFWIIVANSWQQTPAGFHIVGGRAELTDFWAAVFNPSTLHRFSHAVSGALVVGAFFVLGVSAIFLVRKKHQEFARRSFKHALIASCAASLLVAVLGHGHAVQVAETQPAKLAAFEGLWETQKNAPLMLFGIPDADAEVNHGEISLPGALSFLVGMSTDTEVKGLKDFPKEDRPPILLSFLSFHLMVGLGSYFIAFTMLGLLLLYKNKLYDNTLYLKVAALSLPLPFIANEVGWMAAEVGRQPWIVYGIMKTRDAVSISVPAWQIAVSIAMFTVIYSLLFAIWIFLLNRKISAGPEKVA